MFSRVSKATVGSVVVAVTVTPFETDPCAPTEASVSRFHTPKESTPTPATDSPAPLAIFAETCFEMSSIVVSALIVTAVAEPPVSTTLAPSGVTAVPPSVARVVTSWRSRASASPKLVR